MYGASWSTVCVCLLAVAGAYLQDLPKLEAAARAALPRLSALADKARAWRLGAAAEAAAEAAAASEDARKGVASMGLEQQQAAATGAVSRRRPRADHCLLVANCSHVASGAGQVSLCDSICQSKHASKLRAASAPNVATSATLWTHSRRGSRLQADLAGRARASTQHPTRFRLSQHAPSCWTLLQLPLRTPRWHIAHAAQRAGGVQRRRRVGSSREAARLLACLAGAVVREHETECARLQLYRCGALQACNQKLFL